MPPPGGAPAIDTAAFQLTTSPGLLVILAVPERAEGPTQVRVVQLLGSVQRLQAVQVANSVAAWLLVRTGGGPGPLNPAVRPPPLPPGAVPATPVMHVARRDLPALIRTINAELPPEVAGPLTGLVRQAEGVSVVRYNLGTVLPDRDFVAFYQLAGRANGWQPVAENQVRPQAPSVRYRLPNREGVLYVQARPLKAQIGFITTLTVIHLQGNINVNVGRLASPPAAPGAGRPGLAQPRSVPSPGRPAADPLEPPRLERLRW
jgi:hypothetical protein